MSFLEEKNKKPDKKVDIDFGKLQLPMLRRIFPELITNEIVGVQPMSGPVGMTFALRYKYGNYTCPNCREFVHIDDLENYKEEMCPRCVETLQELQDELRNQQSTQTPCITASDFYTNSYVITATYTYTDYC